MWEAPCSPIDSPTHLATDPCLEQLERLLPEIDAQYALTLTPLREQPRQDDGSRVQDTHGLLARALRDLAANPVELDVVAVQRALCRARRLWRAALSRRCRVAS